MQLSLCDDSSGINQVLLIWKAGKAVEAIRKVGRSCLGGHRDRDGAPGDVDTVGWVGVRSDPMAGISELFPDLSGSVMLWKQPTAPQPQLCTAGGVGMEMCATGQSPSWTRGNRAALTVTHGIITFNTGAVNIEQQLSTR